MKFKQPIVIVGYQGRLARACQELLIRKNIDFRVFSKKAPEHIRVLDFKKSSGVIDFSLPQAAEEVSALVVAAKVPWVCGTTGWSAGDSSLESIRSASMHSPVVFDSNFSLGIEVLCQTAEILARALPDEKILITDIHHQNKIDSPSGTALKIQKRLLKVSPQLKIEHRDYRMGEVAGEHRVSVAWEHEWMELTHRASSKEAFSEGALRALYWAQKQPAGLYTMKEVLG